MLVRQAMGGTIRWKLVQRCMAHGQWSSYEASLSSTWRELKAVALVLNSFAPKLAGHRVKWFTDNQSVKQIVDCGSRRQHL